MSNISQFFGGSTTTTVDSATPIGSLQYALANFVADGSWVPADGRVVSKADYPLIEPRIGHYVSPVATSGFGGGFYNNWAYGSGGVKVFGTSIAFMMPHAASGQGDRYFSSDAGVTWSDDSAAPFSSAGFGVSLDFTYTGSAFNYIGYNTGDAWPKIFRTATHTSALGAMPSGILNTSGLTTPTGNEMASSQYRAFKICSNGAGKVVFTFTVRNYQMQARNYAFVSSDHGANFSVVSTLTTIFPNVAQSRQATLLEYVGDRFWLVVVDWTNYASPTYYVASSTDGSSWTTILSGISSSVTSILHDGTQYVLIGSTTSWTSNGITATEKTSDATRLLSAAKVGTDFYGVNRQGKQVKRANLSFDFVADPEIVISVRDTYGAISNIAPQVVGAHNNMVLAANGLFYVTGGVTNMADATYLGNGNTYSYYPMFCTTVGNNRCFIGSYTLSSQTYVRAFNVNAPYDPTNNITIPKVAPDANSPSPFSVRFIKVR